MVRVWVLVSVWLIDGLLASLCSRPTASGLLLELDGFDSSLSMFNDWSFAAMEESYRTKAKMRKGFENLLWWGWRVAIDRTVLGCRNELFWLGCEVMQLYSAERVHSSRSHQRTGSALKEQVRRRSVSLLLRSVPVGS
jgi:hypothetical protein